MMLAPMGLTLGMLATRRRNGQISDNQKARIPMPLFIVGLLAHLQSCLDETDILKNLV
jgi:uncharacterized membrane protein YadS